MGNAVMLDAPTVKKRNSIRKMIIFMLVLLSCGMIAVFADLTGVFHKTPIELCIEKNVYDLQLSRD
jgi:hypothetical protein